MVATLLKIHANIWTKDSSNIAYVVQKSIVPLLLNRPEMKMENGRSYFRELEFNLS